MADQRDCRRLELPKRHSVDLVLDSLAFDTRLRAFDSTAPSQIIVSVLAANGGSAHIVESGVESPAAAQVVEQVLSTLRPVSKNGLLAFRVHVLLGARASIALEPAILCAPLAVEKDGVRRVPFFEVRRVPEESLSSVLPVRNVTPRLRIGTTGQVLEVNLGSGTGVANIDQSLREALFAERYQPALLDGRPVEVWLTGKRVELVR